MSSLLPFVVIGLTSGSIYGLAGTGLVLSYKTSGIFNMAHGAVATVATYVFYVLYMQNGMDWLPAAAISVLGVGAVVGLGLEQLARRLTGCSTAMKIVGTVGVVLLVQGLARALFGTAPQPIEDFLPQGRFQVGDGVSVGYGQVAIVALSVVAVAVLYVFLRRSRTGIAMRAVVDDPDLLDSQGVNPTTVRRTAWVISSLFAALSGVVLAPNIGLDATLLTLLVVQAFGAAAFGAFSSLPLTYLGGLVIGIATSVVTGMVRTEGILAGLAPSIPFIVLFLVLILIPRSRLVDRRPKQVRPAPVWRAPVRVQAVGGGVFALVVLVIPFLVGSSLSVYTAALCSAVLFLSLGLLARTSGQVSLAQAGFAAVGAAAFAHLSAGLGLPWLVSLLAAGLIAVPIGAVVAIPAIRLSGIYLALATFGFGLVLEQMFYTSSIMFGHFTSGVAAARPGLLWLSTDRGYYYLVLVIVAVLAAGVVLVTRSRLGRLLRAMADAPVGLATLGADLNVTRVMVFCLSACLAGFSGALTAALSTQISGQSFSSFSSLALFVLLALAVGGVPWYAFTAAIGLNIIPTFFSGQSVPDYLNALFGLSAVVLALSGGRHPALRRVREVLDRWGGRPVAAPAIAPARRDVQVPQTAGLVSAEPRAAAPSGPSPDGPRPGLQIEGLAVRFGGAVAVDTLNLVAPLGRITGLIGPNGAGKTTTFNACSGLLRPSEGRVLLHGKDVSSLGASARARLGLGRTFQRMELFDTLTVRENVSLGAEAPMAGRNPLRQLAARPAEILAIRDAAENALERCGLGALADVQAGLLSSGQRRLVELARCLAGPYDMLLLDEPSSGLDSAETAAFGRILRDAVADGSRGILLVEHDMSLVLSVCDHLYVLDFGELLAEGEPQEVAASEVVRTAYLGEESVGAGSDPVPVAGQH